MRVLAAEDGHHLRGGALDRERVEVVRDRYEVLLRREQVARVPQ